MLGKLLKYEFKAVGRILLPLYAAWLILAILTGITYGHAGNWIIFQAILSVLYIIMTVGVIIITLILIIQRFYKNLLGSEGYLMFTLPTTTGCHVWNKTISGAVWMLISGAIAIFSMSLSSFFSQSVRFSPGEIVQDILSNVGINNVSNANTVLLLLEIIAVALIIGGEFALKVYGSISLGQLWSSHRILGAIGAYIGFSIVEGALFIAGTVSTNNSNINNGWASVVGHISRMSTFAQSQVILGTIAALTVILGVIYFVITYQLLKRKLNLE